MDEKIMPETKKEDVREEGYFARLLKNDAFIKIIIILGLIGIVLIFFSTSFDLSVPSSAETEEESSAVQEEVFEYQQRLSEELGNMLASMEGVGRTKVMLTMDKGVQNVYASNNDIREQETSRKSGSDENTDKQNTEKTSYITVRQKDGSEKALTVGQIMPKVKGVLVVCEGGGDEKVRESISEAISAILGISEKNICVTKLEK